VVVCGLLGLFGLVQVSTVWASSGSDGDQLAPAVSTLAWSVAAQDGSPVFLYNSPHEGDRGDVLRPGTPLLVLSDELEGDGQRWAAVRTPEDAEGYVQVLWLTSTDPAPDPAAHN
jgi:hypothetical protein